MFFEMKSAVSYVTRPPLDAIMEDAESWTQEAERLSAMTERLSAQGRATSAAGG